MDEDQLKRKGFAGMPWQVHKFGGTSVANAECFLTVAGILLDGPLLNIANESDSTTNATDALHLAVVVSAMGGKPKTTDLLLQTVQDAAIRNSEAVEDV